MSEKEVRKTTTKKTVRKAAPKKAVSKAVVTKKVAPQKKITPKTAVRKAPTPVAAVKASEQKNGRLMLIGASVFVCIVGGSIALGISGSGEISIETRIADLKEQATPEERDLIGSIPIQKTPLRDGGLVPSGAPEETVKKPEPVASSTDAVASSTDAVASSTESMVDDENVQPDESVDDVVTETEEEGTTEEL